MFIVTELVSFFVPTIFLNRSSRRKRGMASNPLFIIPDFFFFIFQMNFAMATLGLKEMGKFFWEGREKKSAQLTVSV